MQTLKRYQVGRVDVWNRDELLEGVWLVIEDSRLVSISKDPEEATPSFHGKLVVPAGVDPQVHMRVPGQSEKETAGSVLQAAVKGGFAALLTMPNTKPVIDDKKVVDLAFSEIRPVSEELGVKVLLSAAMSKGEKGRELVDFTELAEAGVSAFTDDGVGLADDELMLEALRASAKLGLPLLQHAEVPGHGGVLAPGPVQEALGIKAYDEAAEVDMVARDLSLVRQVPGSKYHVLHVSSSKTVALVQAAKKEGLKVSCEVTPHHLWFGCEDIDPSNSSFKMNPPLRSRSDRDSLRTALAQGGIDFVATDHAPHESALKGEQFKTAAFGTLGLETSLRVLLSLRNSGQLSARRLVEVFSYEPARFLDLDESYGQIKVGEIFRAILLDPDVSQVVSEADHAGQCRNSCFLGSRLDGKLSHLFLGEKIHDIG